MYVGFSMSKIELNINERLVARLISEQFPVWKSLSVRQISPGGWDNRCFRLGDDLIVRLPSAEQYADKVNKEQKWLPKLAPNLTVQIPMPIAMGKPSDVYPWHWSVYRWISGQTVAETVNINENGLAKSLAGFLTELHQIDTKDGPAAGKQTFYRGGDLSIYDQETKQAIDILKDKIPVEKVRHIWKQALATQWRNEPVWVHGDVSIGNLLVENGKLSAVIDFGSLCTGDPACDLVIAWTYFDKKSRQVFKNGLSLNEDTWLRARGWALWKALIVAAQICGSNQIENNQAWSTLKALLSAH